MSGGALISTIAGIKTIIKTIKTLKQTTPPGDSPTNIHNAPAELMCLVSWASWPRGK